MFIVFEGPDASGKSTLIKQLYEDLNKEYKVYLTKEPGGTKIGAEIRKVLLNPEFEDMTDLTEAMLFAADRAQHCKEIHEKLDEGYTVLCDRFKESSYVYQGYMKGNNSIVYHLSHVATRGFKQDLTILVLCDPEEALKRFETKDRIELSLKKEKYEQVCEYYKEICEDGIADKEDWIVIDTTGKSSEECYKELLEKLAPYYINFTSRE